MSNIIGVFEKISFPEYGIKDVVAKIDTGAYTGAFHCTNIHLKKMKNSEVLCFSPFDYPEISMMTNNYHIKYVKSSNGERQQRYFVDTKVVIDGKSYKIVLSLADRSEMKWPVLIGRKFLKNNNLLVDAKQTEV